MHDGNLVVKNLDCDEHRKNKRRELDGSVSASCRLMRLGCMTWRGCTNALVGAQYPLHVVVKQPPPPLFFLLPPLPVTTRRRSRRRRPCSGRPRRCPPPPPPPPRVAMLASRVYAMEPALPCPACNYLVRNKRGMPCGGDVPRGAADTVGVGVGLAPELPDRRPHRRPQW